MKAKQIAGARAVGYPVKEEFNLLALTRWRGNRILPGHMLVQSWMPDVQRDPLTGLEFNEFWSNKAEFQLPDIVGQVLDSTDMGFEHLH
jgi:hypothetical protein